MNNESTSTPATLDQPDNQGGRYVVISVAVGILLIIIAGLLWLFTSATNSPIGAGWYLFSFVSGLSMIVLPCTLPLAFVIVPLSMGRGYIKGFSVALAFGLGVAITLSIYGILAALLGKAVFAFSDSGGETIKNIFYVLAGIFSLLFALGELGLIKFTTPSYSGAVPSFIQKRKDIAKALMLGLFLGNIGVGCPHPATPIILGQIGVVGSVWYGWLLFFVHALGRILPLLLLATLGILGVNATKALMQHKDKIAHATAWAMVFVGGFLFTLGFFSHDWWINSGTHTLFEEIVQEERFTGLLGRQLESEVVHRHGIAAGTGFFGLPLALGNYALVALWIIPLWWWWFNKRWRIRRLPPQPGELSLTQQALLTAQKWFIILLTIILAITFIYILPQRFLASETVPAADQHEAEMVLSATDDGDTDHEHDEASVAIESSNLNNLLANRLIYLIVAITVMSLLTWGVFYAVRHREPKSPPPNNQSP